MPRRVDPAGCLALVGVQLGLGRFGVVSGVPILRKRESVPGQGLLLTLFELVVR